MGTPDRCAGPESRRHHPSRAIATAFSHRGTAAGPRCPGRDSTPHRHGRHIARYTGSATTNEARDASEPVRRGPRGLEVPHRRTSRRAAVGGPPNRAPAGTRTLTRTILSRLPLPIGLPGRGHQSGTRARRNAEREMTQMVSAEHPDRAFESSHGAQPQAKARYAFGRAANSSNAARGLDRASSAIRSRRNRKLTMSSTNTRILRSHVGIARPW